MIFSIGVSHKLGTCKQLFTALGYTFCNQLCQKVKDEQASAFSRTLIAFSEHGGMWFHQFGNFAFVVSYD
jgi:hypothetical protein